MLCYMLEDVRAPSSAEDTPSVVVLLVNLLTPLGAIAMLWLVYHRTKQTTELRRFARVCQEMLADAAEELGDLLIRWGDLGLGPGAHGVYLVARYFAMESLAVGRTDLGADSEAVELVNSIRCRFATPAGDSDAFFLRSGDRARLVEFLGAQDDGRSHAEPSLMDEETFAEAVERAELASCAFVKENVDKVDPKKWPAAVIARVKDIESDLRDLTKHCRGVLSEPNPEFEKLIQVDRDESDAHLRRPLQ